ncbi:hypothetical protein T484DRAFT_1920903, partial [Baffinella frigidus]
LEKALAQTEAALKIEEEIAPLIPPGISRLVLIPPAFLAALPLHALPLRNSKRTISRLVLIPPASLAALPLHALPVHTSILSKHTSERAPAPSHTPHADRVLAANKEEATHKGATNKGLEIQGDLRFTGWEASRVAELFEEGFVLRGEAANEEEVRWHKGANADALHFAATFDQWDAGLHLAGEEFL